MRSPGTSCAGTQDRLAERMAVHPDLLAILVCPDDHGPLLEAEVARLDQARLSLTERRICAELQLGRHRSTLGELASLVMRNRFHEDLHAQFMVALYRSGNRTRALEVFHTIRRSMISELGLEPSRKLLTLQQAIMNADPILDEAMAR